MAFVSDASPDQQNPNQTPGQNPLSQQAPITSAPNASSAKGATGQPSNTSPAQPFTNLSSYLTANAPQIQAEGQQIAGGLTQQYGQVKGNIDTANTNFNNQVNSSYTPMNQGVIDSFGTSPASVAGDPTKAAAFKGMYNDSYTGPANFESTPDYLGLSGQVQSAVTNAQNLQTPEGIKGYFSSTSPTYTQGMGTLDAALLQGNPDVVANIQAAATPFQNLPGYLTSAVTSNDAAAQAANTQAQQAKAATQSAYKSFTDPFVKAQNDQYTGLAKQAVDYNGLANSATGKIGNNDFASLTPDEAKLIGYDQAATPFISAYGKTDPFSNFTSSRPIAFNQMYNPGTQMAMPKTSDVFTPDELANYQALSALSGNAPTFNFDVPTTATEGAYAASPAQKPLFDSQTAVQSILNNYRDLNDSYAGGASAADKKSIMDYMNQLRTELGQPTDNGTGAGSGGGGTGDTWFGGV